MEITEVKAGKRVRGSMVKLLNEAIENLSAVLVWAHYEDKLDEDEKAFEFPRRAVLGDIERSRGQLTTRPSSSGGGGTANWNAKVGEIILGNLMRGEGGRFASARNIGKMMLQLDDVGITPDMFTGMQSLLAGEGKTLSAGVMADLRSAGLVNDQGVVQSKANEIINAVKTGQPDNLKAVLKPSAGGGGGGGGGGAAKPTTEEKYAANVEELKPAMVEATNLDGSMVDALVDFYNGESIDEELIQSLVDMGFLAFDAEQNLFMTTHGRSLVSNMQRGNLRKALDAYSRAVNSMAEPEKKPKTDKAKENIERVSSEIADRGDMSADNLSRLIGFDEGEEYPPQELGALIDSGLLSVTSDGDIYMNTRGQRLISRMESGDLRDALDAISRAKQTKLNAINRAKTRRAETANALIKDDVISKSQADALIRAWVRKIEGASEGAIASLNSLGLMSGSNLTGYGVLVMSMLDVGAIEAAIGFIEAASRSKMFHGVKQLGSDYFLTWTTNAFKDREQETFTTQSIEDYLKNREKSGNTEEPYDFWHIDGTEFATVQWQGGVGRQLVEIGKYDDTPTGHAFKEFFDRYPNGHPILAPYGWGCSHEYAYSPQDREDGVYEWFNKRKSTVLPLHEAANPFTLAEFGLGAKNMKLSKRQKEAITIIADEIGRPDLIDEIQRVGMERTSMLEKNGFEFKANVCKTEDDVCYPAADYAYVPDPQKPSTWKLRMSQGKPGNITVEQLGRAAAAFSEGGFRGNRVEIPESEVAKVKDKIKAKYRAQGVSDDEIPESIKGLKDETMNRSDISKKMAELSESLPEEKQAEWDEAAEKLVEPDSEVTAIHRMLMEMLVDLPEETRAQAEELVAALADLAEPIIAEDELVDLEMEADLEVPVEEEVTEEELVEEELSDEEIVEEELLEEEEKEEDEEDDEDEEMRMDREGEMKSISDSVAETLVDTLHLRDLSAMLEDQASDYKSVTDAVSELVTKVKALSERIEKLEENADETESLKKEVRGVKEEVSGVKEKTDAVVAEKQRWTPFWANGVSNATVARDTQMDAEEEKSYRKPEVPQAIAGIRNRVLHQD
jgi:hypothetical protein